VAVVGRSSDSGSRGWFGEAYGVHP
jgi:hypothetical protein